MGAAATGHGDAQILKGLQQIAPAGAAQTPAQEAAAHGLRQCGGIIDKMVSNSVNGDNAQSSMWRTQDADKHIFQSVIGISQPGTPPDALAAIISAPLGNGTCDGAAVGIYPLAVDCTTAEAAVKNGGRLLFMLRNSRVMLDANNERLFLLPGANNTCIAVAVKSYFQGDP